MLNLFQNLLFCSASISYIAKSGTELRTTIYVFIHNGIRSNTNNTISGNEKPFSIKFVSRNMKSEE